MQLAQLILFVHDAPRMEAFYTQTFGLQRIDGDAAAGFVRLADPAGGAILAIHYTPAVGPPTGRREDTCFKPCFQVADIEAARAQLVAAGASPGDVHRYEAIAYCDATDPEGNVFQITTR